jgi:DNA-binding transcriptional MerR regulator
MSNIQPPNEQAKQLLRASQLAELADVSVPTIKHYVNEGLIPKPLKTGKTMAYYDPACIERIKRIKRLQKEQFLPLDVIKRLLDSGPAYEEELQMGQAILKSHKVFSAGKPVPESSIERRTGYPLRKIRLLEKEGLVMPARREGTREYDATDCRIIEIMKRREQLGVPFDHSVETLGLYRDALEHAVSRDIQLFARNLLGVFSPEQTVKFLTEVDDSLDSFILLIRQKMLWLLSSEAIRQMNEISDRLGMLSVFPVKGKYLPSIALVDAGLNIFRHFCSGAFDAAAGLIRQMRENEMAPFIPAAVIAYMLAGDLKGACSLVEQYIPRPAGRVFDDAAAALAYMTSVGESSGFSGPTHLMRKALAHLEEIERAMNQNSPFAHLAKYICGAIYTFLPEMFGKSRSGIKMLEQLERSLRKRDVKIRRIPLWVEKTLDFEIIPAVETRVNRFLAEAYLRQKDAAAAERFLSRVIELTEPPDEHSRWARLIRLEIKPERR